MRVMDGLMAIPAILLAIAMVSLFRAGVGAVIAAIAVPDERWGERPLLFVDVSSAEVAAKLTEAEIKGFLKGKVASWWVPDRVVVGVVGSIPHGATGKVDKKELRRRYLEGKEGALQQQPPPSQQQQQQQPLSKL